VTTGIPGYPRGVWVDAAGTLHFDLEEMIRGTGHEPTPDNLRTMEQAARDMAAQIGATVEERNDAP
jgi:hypothetical protein